MIKKRKIPNFFIVGAPKSGTTALYEYLKIHPDIFLAEKEIHYFISDFNFKKRVNTIDDYLKLYENVKNEKAVGDASVWYLYSKTAAKNIKNFNPDSKIIIMLRNPLEMVYSLHSQLFYSGNEDIDKFNDAVIAEKDRRFGKRIPRYVSFVESLFYSKVGLYNEQINRYLNIFGKEKVCIIFFDDFILNTKKEYSRILNFLELDQKNFPIFKKINTNKVPRSIILHNRINDIKFNKRIDFISSETLKKIINWLILINTKKEERQRLDGNILNQLKTIYQDEIKKLGDFLGRDLNHWLR